jgi:hypothetical protein
MDGGSGSLGLQVWNVPRNLAPARKEKGNGHWCLTPVIPATQESEIRRVTIQSQPGEIIHQTLSQK